MINDIYLLKEGNQIGPFKEEALRGMVEVGSVTRDDLVWHEGLSEWVPLSSILELESSGYQAGKFGRFFKNKIMVQIFSVIAGVLVIGGGFYAAFSGGNSRSAAKGEVSNRAFAKGEVSNRALSDVGSIMEEYFKAETEEERAALVVDGEKILPEMKRHYKGGLVGDGKIISVSSPTVVLDNDDGKYFSVEVERSGKNRLGNDFVTKSLYWFRERDGNLLIDWKISLGKNEVSLAEISRASTVEIVPRRIMLGARLGDYFNYEFKELKNTHIAVRLSNNGYAYLHKDSDLGKRFSELLDYKNEKNITVLVRPVKASKDDDFWIIDDLVRPYWAPETSEERKERLDLAATHKRHLAFTQEQNKIDDILRAGEGKLTMLPVAKVFYDGWSDVVCAIDYKGKKAEIEFLNEEVENKIAAIMDASDNSDQNPLGLLVSMKAESESSLLVQDLLYTGFFVETSEQREERLNTQGEFARKAAMIFGGKRDEALQSLAPDKLYIRDQIKLVKNGKEAKYRTGLDLLVAIKIAAGGRIPDSDADRKILLKSVLGKPDYSDKEVFSNGNWLEWEFRSVIQNQDTEKYTEHAKLVFGPELMVTVSGPKGFGEKDGGIRSPNGRTTQTYESIESLLITYSSVIESYFR